MENVRKHRGIKLVTTNKRRNQLVSESNYHTTKCFSENLLAIKMKKVKLKMNKPVYLGLSILEISKTLMYEFWSNYIKPKYQQNAKTAVLFILKLKMFMKILQMMLKKDLIHQIIKSLSTGKNKRVIGLMKDELRGKIVTEFAALKPKTYSFLMDDGNNDKKAKGKKV